MRVRDMLVATYLATDQLYNWGLERWNWARYHPSVFDGDIQANIRFWDGAVGLWENEEGDIVGVAHSEMPQPGEAYFQRRPGYGFLLEEMLDYAEGALTDREGGLRIYVYDHDRPFQALLERRGYRRDAEHPGYDSEFVIDEPPVIDLPPGYAVHSMADENDLARRCKVQGLGFDHPDPAEWTTPAAYREVQKAPDYRQDLDLYVVGPDGEFVSSCIVWYDEHNRMGFFEPVSTHMGFRLRGFGRAVVWEGIRRAAALGARRARVGSGQPFYEAIGFRKQHVSYPWTKKR
jgi:hypothetical protein